MSFVNFLQQQCDEKLPKDSTNSDLQEDNKEENDAKYEVLFTQDITMELEDVSKNFSEVAANFLKGSNMTDSELQQSFYDEEIQRQNQLTAQKEWDQIDTVTLNVEKGPNVVDEGDQSVSFVLEVSVLSYQEISQYFLSLNLSHLKPQIQTSVYRSGLSAVYHFFFGPPRLHSSLVSSREQIFCIAACDLDNKDVVHLKALQALYRSLTGSRLNCPRYGGHWEEIGFQGNDPATDLRGTGMLSMINLLYLLSKPPLLSLARDIYQLSHHKMQNFPFCVMSINISKIALQAFREDCLNRECNKRKDVMSVVNNFYAGTYLKMYQMWKKDHKTIRDSGIVLKGVEHFAKKSPEAVLKNLDDHLQHSVKKMEKMKKMCSAIEGGFINMNEFDDVSKN